MMNMDLSSTSSFEFSSSSEKNEPDSSTRTSWNINRPPSFLPLFADLLHRLIPQTSFTGSDCEQGAEATTSTDTNTCLQQSITSTPQTSLQADHSISAIPTIDLTTSASNNNLLSVQVIAEEYWIPVQTIYPVVIYLRCFGYPTILYMQFIVICGSVHDTVVSSENNSTISTSDEFLHRSDVEFVVIKLCLYNRDETRMQYDYD